MCGWELGLSNSFSRFQFSHDVWTLHVWAMMKLRNKLSGTHASNIFSRRSSHRRGHWCSVAAGGCACPGGTATLGNGLRIALRGLLQVHWQLRAAWGKGSESTWKAKAAPDPLSLQQSPHAAGNTSSVYVPSVNRAADLAESPQSPLSTAHVLHPVCQRAEDTLRASCGCVRDKAGPRGRPPHAALYHGAFTIRWKTRWKEMGGNAAAVILCNVWLLLGCSFSFFKGHSKVCYLQHFTHYHHLLVWLSYTYSRCNLSKTSTFVLLALTII